MKISFTGKSKNKNILKSDVRAAVKFYAHTLMSARVCRRLDIQIHFLKLKGGLAAQQCAIVNTLSEKFPNRFLIEVDERLYEKPTFMALAHEMVHVEQCATGRRYDYVNKHPYVKWDKQVINSADIDYWDSPWEIEAYGKQHGLYNRYMNHLDEKNGIKISNSKRTRID